jgi:hypothetical protein
MTDQFDPYYNWLAIPKHESANGGPDHYRLLGVPRYEENPNVISNAADQRCQYLRTLQTGKHSTESQRLLNEVAAAAGCLLNPERKTAYDRQLRQLDSMRALASPAVALGASNTPTPSTTHAPSAGPSTAVIAAAVAVPVALALIVVAILSLGGGSDTPNNQAAVVPPSSDPAPMRPGPPPPVAVSSTRVPTASPPSSTSGPPSATSVAASDPAIATPPATAAPPATSASSEVVATAIPLKFDPVHGLDLLPGAASDLRLIRGEAEYEMQVLSVPRQSTAFTLPADFPDEYVLEVDVTRESGTNSICFGIPVHGHPLTAVIDGFFSTKSGLACVNNREIYTEGNPLVKAGPVLTNGKQATVRIEVTVKAVRLSVDGKQIVAWDWDPAAKVRSAQGMQTGDLTRLHIFTWDAAYRISRLELLPVR